MLPYVIADRTWSLVVGLWTKTNDERPKTNDRQK
jgi:hypothetical protein